ncbi:hypothetical protein DAEQUDRAFT_807233 [Daedalea quercina L-15889]|uniref:Uncharacterized protein n=1 Tax=Daedalea quercina L-15889 TaxID=1314783 RepID=A0A165UIE8_9APHY|nr:hypothetical protein DAEQUDRAFT_807233 [Daedalea quercina L-15889]
MAKTPKSTPSSTPPPRVSHTPPSARRRRASPSPSSAVLGLFATLASAATAVDGSPVSTPPPDFLCPQLVAIPPSTQAPTAVPRDRIRRRAATSSTSATRSSRSGPVADKYVSCDDGRWRKTDVWTLYGSTFCTGAACTATVTSASATALGEDGSATATSMPAAITDMDISNDDTLPSGWSKDSTLHDDPLTPVIITLSVVLALGICAFIVICVVWRRRRSQQLKDPEWRGRKKTDEQQDAGEGLQRAKSQQRLWARASARWKANIRQSARRRRKRNPAAAKDVDTRSLVEQPTHPSSVSLRTSASQSSFSHSIASTTSSRHRDSYDPSSSALQETRYSPSRPPAYLSGPSDAPASPQGTFPSTAFASTSRPIYDKAGFPLDGARDTPLPDGDGLPPADPFDSGHIATDDKATLARMASLASAPPSRSGSGTEEVGEPSTLLPLVPLLEDEFEPIPPELRITDYDEYVGMYSDVSGCRDAPSPGPFSFLSASGTQTPSYSREPSPHPALPAPPTRGRLAAPTFYEYPVSFEEDVLSAEPEVGPSAPPFDHGDSLAASAPPMESDYDSMAAVVLPSAPPMDDLDGRASSPEVPRGDHWRADSRLSTCPAPPSHRSASPLVVPDSRASPPRYIP